MTISELEAKVNNLENAFLQMSRNNIPVTDKADRVPSLEAQETALNTKVDNNQAETDELMLDHEERLILLEVGE